MTQRGAKASAAEVARAHGERAFQVLVAIAEDPEAAPTARIAAANAILDRAYGKAVPPVDHAGDVAVRKSLADFYGEASGQD
ncbi:MULTISPECIES: hypothetical protein [Asticcacaulis]|uniref:hypothetical protein n=1 Tax=Asticcacaulis TaxID=76890 RepID=UPI001AEAEF28|nr:MULTISPECIES: hypothetical protein [Asticcacaulis]MBP2160279.1 hypothetical protein [Asticcacaulis solisilvae]MDR6801418.1 hypothetical protein [Asticcacaulis sp. BE141]